MEKFWTKYQYNHTLANEGIIYIATASVDGYDEILYIKFENKMTPAKWRDLGNWTVPITARTRAGLVGHCYRQKIVDNVAVTPKIYYGTIEQPCEDLSCFVALDPHNLPTVYTGSDGTETAVKYTLTYTSTGNVWTWDGGANVTINANNTGNVDGIDADSGELYVFHDTTPCFTSVDLEVFVLS